MVVAKFRYTIRDDSWVYDRLVRRARNARQAEAYVKGLNPEAYPYASYLAVAHARAADVYEEALVALQCRPTEIVETGDE